MSVHRNPRRRKRSKQLRAATDHVAIFRESVAPNFSRGQLVPAHVEVTLIDLAAHPTS